MTVIEIARLFRFVRELPENRGQRVEAIQHWSGGQPGDSWCCEFATMVLDLFFQGESPVPRGGACQDVYEMARQGHWLVTDPKPNDLYLFVNDADHAHHVGIYCGEGRGIAGNTSPLGDSSDGGGVYEHELPLAPGRIRFVRVPGVN